MKQFAWARGKNYAWLPIIVSLLSLFPQSEGNYGVPYILYDYRYGFVKRGLLGMPFRHIHHLTHFEFFTIEFVMLAVAVFLIYAALSRAVFSDGKIGQITAILLCAPTMLPHLAQIFMPTDTVLFALLAASLFCFTRLNPLPAAAISLAFCLIALFVHEAFLMVMYPTVLCVFLHQWRRGQIAAGIIAAHAAVMLVTFLLITHFGSLTVDPMKAYADAQARSAFPLDVQLFRLMHQTMAQYRRESMDFVAAGWFEQNLTLSVIITAPYFAFVYRLLRRCLLVSGYSRVETLLVFLLCCGPLLLVPLSTDWMRWASDCCICASLFTIFMYCVEEDEGPAEVAMLQFADESNLFMWLGYIVAVGSFGGMYLTSADRLIKGYFSRVPPGGSPHPGK